jgi:hypothetical protein
MPARSRGAIFVLQRDGLDPVDGVLENEQIAQAKDKLMRQQRIRGRCTEVEKERAVWFQQTPNLGGPLDTPIQITATLSPVGIPAISNAQVVRRRRDDKVDGGVRHFGHAFKAVAVSYIE